MKKILSLFIACLLTLSALAQLPANRTTATVIADALAQLPAANQTKYGQLMKDLVSTGEEGILSLASKLNAPGKGGNSTVEYALSGIAAYASDPANAAVKSKIADAFKKAYSAATVPEIKAFLNEQLRLLGAVDSPSPFAETEIPAVDKNSPDYLRIAALQAELKNVSSKDLSKKVLAALKDPSVEYRTSALSFASAKADANLFSSILKTLPKAKFEVKTDIYNFLTAEAKQSDKTKILQSLDAKLLAKTVETMQKDLSSADFDLKKSAATALLASGSTSSLSSVAKLLASDDSKDIELAKSLLASSKGDVASTVADYLHSASDKGKIAGLELLASRKATGKLKSALLLAQSGTPEVQAAAYKSLKDLVTIDDAETLAAMVFTADKKYIPDIQQAGISALSSLPTNEQISLLQQGMDMFGAKRYLLYLPLAATGDKSVLPLITDGFSSSDKDTKDAAFDALLNWKGAETADLLYSVCKNPKASEYFDKAYDAYLKKASNPAQTGENRLIFLRKAMEIAKTDAQKNVALKEIGKTGTFLGLLYAGEFLDTPALKENAAQAVMNIALNHKEYTGENVAALLTKAASTLNNPDADYQRQSIAKHLAEMPKEKGFVSLFNGRDLTGWKGLVENPIARAKMKPADLKKAQVKADEQMRKDWVIENGLLAFVGTGYDNICTEKQYGDFEMYVDWLLDPAGPEADAGIYLRGAPQVQIWDIARTNVGAEVGSGGLYNNQVHQSKPLKVADNTLGEWNTMYIKMVGDRVTVVLNGELVTDNVILENYWNRELPIFPTEQIELQAHGSKVYYRNIYIKELESPKPFELSAQEKKEGFQILFDGTNMHQWTGNIVDYQLENGCIYVNPTSSFGGNLYTKKEYSNFAFRFEFQLTPSANNGVGIRAPMEGDNAYNAMEIQILDCEHPVYADIKPYQHHGSVYGVIAAEHGAMKPVGEWNEEEIYADGDRIRVTLNGKVILDGDIREASKNGTVDHQPHPGLLNKSGHIGFLGHGSELKLRNIRIKEL